jgi:hypothetical protein
VIDWHNSGAAHADLQALLAVTARSCTYFTESNPVIASLSPKVISMRCTVAKLQSGQPLLCGGLGFVLRVALLLRNPLNYSAWLRLCSTGLNSPLPTTTAISTLFPRHLQQPVHGPEPEPV